MAIKSFPIAGTRRLMVGWESDIQERLAKIWYSNPQDETEAVLRLIKISTKQIQEYKIPFGVDTIDVSPSVTQRYGVRPVPNPDTVGDLGFVDDVKIGLRVG